VICAGDPDFVEVD